MRNPGMGHLHLHLNRNKRSIALDLKTPEAARPAFGWPRAATPCFYNIRPRPWPGWACPEAVAARNPRIVYLGAWLRRAGTLRRAARLRRPDPGTGRHRGAVCAAERRGAALRAPDAGGSRRRPACRHRAGVGRAACPSQRTRAAGRDSHVRGHGAHDAGRPPGRRHVRPAVGPAGYARLLAPHRRPYATADGYLCLLICNDKHWRNFFALIGQPELADDPRCSHGARAAHIGEVTPSSPMSSATAPRTTGWPIWRAPTSRRPACTPSKTCWMTNTWPPPVSSARRTTTEGRLRTPAPLGRCRHAHRHPPPRPALGQHSANCWRKPVTTRPPSTPCSRAAPPFPRFPEPQERQMDFEFTPDQQRCAPPSPASVNAIPTNTGWSATAKAAFPSRCTPTWPATAGWASPCRRNTAAPAWHDRGGADDADHRRVRRGFAGASAVHMNIFGLNPVVVFGDDAQRRRWLPPLIAGRERPASP